MAQRVNILAFDTSLSACSVALQYNGEMKSLHKIAPMQQTKCILPMITELLNCFSITIKNLDVIAYGCGPGSFTGIRIASSVAQGISFATGLPVIPISSLAALAQTAYSIEKQTQILVAVDARMEQIYWAQYHLSQAGVMELIGEEKVYNPEQIGVVLNGNYYGVGDGFLHYRDVLASLIGSNLTGINTQLLPTAEAIIALSKSKWDKQQWVKTAQAIPVYLR